MIYVISTSTLKKGCKEEFIRIAKANIPAVLAEKGCISYQLTEDFQTGFPKQTMIGEDTLTFVECWESLDHLKAHLQAPHMKAFVQNVADLRVSSTLRVVTPAC